MTFNDGPAEGAILDNPMNILSTGRWQCQGCWWTSVGRVVVCPALLVLADPCQWPFGLQSMLKGQQSPSVRDNTPTGHSVDCISAPEEKQKRKGNGGLEVCPTVWVNVALSEQHFVYPQSWVFRFPFWSTNRLQPPGLIGRYFLQCRLRMYKLGGRWLLSMQGVPEQLFGWETGNVRWRNSQPSSPLVLLCWFAVPRCA